MKAQRRMDRACFMFIFIGSFVTETNGNMNIGNDIEDFPPACPPSIPSSCFMSLSLFYLEHDVLNLTSSQTGHKGHSGHSVIYLVRLANVSKSTCPKTLLVENYSILNKYCYLSVIMYFFNYSTWLLCKYVLIKIRGDFGPTAFALPIYKNNDNNMPFYICG